MSFVGSSDRWGDESCARLCEIIMDANDGMAQQIIENRTDLLDLKSKEELEAFDDFGLTLAFLAVNNDRPEMIRYLAKRGVDMKKPCDTMGFGNPMFYAVNMGKLDVIQALHSVGCSVNEECDTFLNFKPEYYASRIDNKLIHDKIIQIKTSEIRAATLFKRNYLKYRWHKIYSRKKSAIICIQRIARGYLVRSYSSRMMLQQNSVSDGNSATSSQIHINTAFDVSGSNSNSRVEGGINEEDDEDEGEGESVNGGIIGGGLEAGSSVFTSSTS